MKSDYFTCIRCGTRYDAKDAKPEYGKAFAHRYCPKCRAALPVLPVITAIDSEEETQ